MTKKMLFLGCSLLLVGLLLSPLIASASEATQDMQKAGQLELRVAYKKKIFFTKKPLKTYGKYNLVKTEKVNGGYNGYYN